MTFNDKLEKKLVHMLFDKRYESIIAANFAKWARQETLKEVLTLLNNCYYCKSEGSGICDDCRAWGRSADYIKEKFLPEER